MADLLTCRVMLRSAWPVWVSCGCAAFNCISARTHRGACVQEVAAATKTAAPSPPRAQAPSAALY